MLLPKIEKVLNSVAMTMGYISLSWQHDTSGYHYHISDGITIM